MSAIHACCRYHRAQQAKARARVHALYNLIGGTPRHWAMVASHWSPSQRTTMGLALDGKPCPCHDTPDPEAFREFFERIAHLKSDGETARIEMGRILDRLETTS